MALTLRPTKGRRFMTQANDGERKARMVVVVVDTVGDIARFAPRLRERFPWAEFHGHAPSYLRDFPQPHGFMCAEKIVLAFAGPDAPRLELHFARVFDGAGRFSTRAYERWLFGLLRELASEGRLYVNNSWGAYVGAWEETEDERAEAERWREFIFETSAVVFWAAGNNGDYRPDEDRDLPQSLLTDCSFKVGSRARDGTPSAFSGDSKSSPPICVMWAEDVLLYNGCKDRYDIGSGTSFAAPKACAVAAYHGWDFLNALVRFQQTAARSERYQGPLPHPKWGWGDGEPSYQRLIASAPGIHSERRDAQLRLAARAEVEWFDNRLGPWRKFRARR